MRIEAESADELRTRIANYQQSRRTAAPSMHRWLDALIAESEDKLRQLLPPGEAGSASAAADLDKPASEFRSTYPLDERAPRQRIF
jgi:hypothetical protein